MPPRYLSNNMDRYIFVRAHDPGQDVYLHLRCLESRVERAPERRSIHLLLERVRIHVQLTPPTPMGRTLMSSIGKNIGMMNKFGMRTNPTLVFLVELKMNLKQLVRMTMATSMMLTSTKQWH